MICLLWQICVSLVGRLLLFVLKVCGLFLCSSRAADGKVAKAEASEVSQQHSNRKKEHEREEQEINDSEEEGDLLEEEEVRINSFFSFYLHTSAQISTLSF